LHSFTVIQVCKHRTLADVMSASIHVPIVYIDTGSPSILASVRIMDLCLYYTNQGSLVGPGHDSQ